MLLEVNDLAAGYGRGLVIAGVSMTVGEGEIVALIGHNGSGKSTTLKAVVGLLKPTTGEVLLMGRRITGTPTSDIVRAGISVVPQGRSVFANLSADDNLLLATYSLAGNGKVVRQRLAMVYDLFPVLRDRRRQVAGTMSGGEQQMLSLGMALVTAPRLLILDEPSVGLSPVLVQEVMQRISDVNQRLGVGVLMVEQNVTQALRIAQRAYVLKLGRVTYEGGAAELRAHPHLWQMF